jgi:hypothetical protein
VLFELPALTQLADRGSDTLVDKLNWIEPH